jgi:hypothetical protein
MSENFNADDDDMPALEEISDTPAQISTCQTKESHDNYLRWLRDYRAILLIFKHQFPNNEHLLNFNYETTPLGDTEDTAWFIGIVGRAAGRAKDLLGNQ